MKLIDQKAKESWNENTMFSRIKKTYKDEWNFMFDLGMLGDLNKPLTPKILSNPYHKITRHLLYIYSMESFVYQDLNRACRDQDTKQIQYYGAYAAALSYIIFGANQNSKDRLRGHNKLYRGLKMDLDDLLTY